LGAFRRQQMLQLAASVGGLQHLLALLDEFLLSWREALVQRLEKFAKAFGQRRILGRAIHVHAGAGARKAGDVSNHSSHLDERLEATRGVAVVTALVNCSAY